MNLGGPSAGASPVEHGAQVAEHPGRAPQRSVADDVDDFLRANDGDVQQVGLPPPPPGPAARTGLVAVRSSRDEDHHLGFAALDGVDRADASAGPVVGIGNGTREDRTVAQQPSQPVRHAHERGHEAEVRRDASGDDPFDYRYGFPVFLWAPSVLAGARHIDPTRRPQPVADRRWPRRLGLHHQLFIRNAIADLEHGRRAAAMHQQRHAHGSAACPGRELGAPGGGVVGERLDRGVRSAEPPSVDTEGATDRRGQTIRQQDHGRRLDRVADDDGPVRAQERAHGLLRSRLPGLVNEEPTQRLRRQPAEHGADQGEGGRQGGHHQEQARPQVGDHLVLGGIGEAPAVEHLQGRVEVVAQGFGGGVDEGAVKVQGHLEQAVASAVFLGGEPGCGGLALLVVLLEEGFVDERGVARSAVLSQALQQRVQRHLDARGAGAGAEVQPGRARQQSAQRLRDRTRTRGRRGVSGQGRRERPMRGLPVTKAGRSEQPIQPSRSPRGMIAHGVMRPLDSRKVSPAQTEEFNRRDGVGDLPVQAAEAIACRPPAMQRFAPVGGSSSPIMRGCHLPPSGSSIPGVRPSTAFRYANRPVSSSHQNRSLKVARFFALPSTAAMAPQLSDPSNPSASGLK